MSKFTNLVKRLYYDKRVRFLFVGVLNTIVGYGITMLVEVMLGIDIINTDKTVPYYNLKIGIANFVGQIIGMIHSYFWNKYFTFRSKTKSRSEIVRFIIVSAAQYGVNVGIEMLFTNVTDLSSFAVKPIQILFSTVVGYIGNNFFSFKDQTADEESKRIAEEIKQENNGEGHGGDKKEESAKDEVVKADDATEEKIKEDVCEERDESKNEDKN